MILTVTMNPAIDTAYQLDKLIIDDVNRVAPKKTAGGKGLNVSRVLCQLVRGVDRGVHGDGENHVHSFSRGQPTGPGSTQCLLRTARPSRASRPVG